LQILSQLITCRIQQRSSWEKCFQNKSHETFEEAMLNEHWKMVVYDEIKALQNNNTWELTTLPDGKKTVGCKWLFTVKYKADGIVER